MNRQSLAFEFAEDQRRFEQLLCEPGEDLTNYTDLFDFRSSTEKRRQFERIRGRVFRELSRRFGRTCILQYADDCDVRSGLCVDHLIPISTNKLNKELRKLGSSRTLDGKLRKAPTQTFGSNKPRNLILACENCNSLKMNRLLPGEVLKRVLRHIDEGLRREAGAASPS